ncbi:MAG: TIGR04283 family arsenosugar biosynthesis glycosyltransferase [Saprospiraceae bacterium]
MKLSIIIPTLNEAGQITKLLDYLFASPQADRLELIIVDGQSSDNTCYLARQAGAKVVVSSERGRAIQMNKGAEMASGDVLYFLHADTLPPSSFYADIQTAIQGNVQSGSYRLSFDFNHWFLNLHAWFTRFNASALRYGDQSLFVSKACFEKVGGFDDQLLLMEDYEIVKRIRKACYFKVLQKRVITSARRYLANGIFRLQVIFYLIYFMHRIGFSQARLLKVYQRLIN